MSFSANITAVDLTGFGPVDQSGGSPTITNYGGDTLYCHVTSIGPGQVAITFNQFGPSSFPAIVGNVQLVTIIYQSPVNPSAAQTLTFSPQTAMATYNGEPFNFYLTFNLADGTYNATLMVSQQSASTTAAAKASTAIDASSPVLSLVVLGTQVTGGDPQGFFTSVPVDSPNYYQYTTATIQWPQQGGSLGPMGVVNVP